MRLLEQASWKLLWRIEHLLECALRSVSHVFYEDGINNVSQ